MDPNEKTAEDIKILLKKNLEISEENNKMLHSMKRAAKRQLILRIIYFLIIIGGLTWLFHFFQPYFEGVKNSYNSYQETQSKAMELFNNFLKDDNQ